LKAEGRKQKAEVLLRETQRHARVSRPDPLLLSAFCFLLLNLLSNACFGSEMTVDKKTLTLDDTVTITIVLDSRIDTEELRVPALNLDVRGPSQSLEYNFDIGGGAYQKIVRYIARPRWVGAARVGPLTLRRRDGQVETLPAIDLQIVPPTTNSSNDPLTLLHEMIATDRDPVFLVVEFDKEEAFAGEEIIATWTMYNATNVQRYSVSEVPHLDDFWSEEIPLPDSEPERVFLGGTPVQRIAVRRAALFPLRSGRLTVGSMSISASVMRRVSSDRFGIPFEGILTDITRRSPLVTVDAKPLPPGPPVNIVGDVTMACSVAPQQSGGPVVVNATVTGWANLRGAAPPSFERAIDGEMQVTDAGLFVDRSRAAATMTRHWRYVIFPAHNGTMTIPPLSTSSLTGAGMRNTLRCSQRTLDVVAGEAPRVSAPRDVAVKVPFAVWPLAVALVALALAIPRVWRARTRRALVRSLVRETPEETRVAVDEHLASRGFDPVALVTERSDRGDAYRSLRSLTDNAARLEVTRGELRRRVREVVSE
jgi:hypothetical protein